jgi:signal transduction histidine kinase
LNTIGPEAATSKKVNILLVDDQPARLLSYETILSQLGENLIKASSASQAFDCLIKDEIALILIDVCMPELDGFELATMIREHPRFQKTAIIFVSGVSFTGPDQLRGYQLGAVDFVPVPIVPELLRAKVKVFLDLYRKTRQLEQFNAELEKHVAERTSELRQLNEELESRIELRTREREAALAQLFEAQKMETIGQLTGGVAHDFNNLLMAILGSLNLLAKQRSTDTDRSRRLLENAIQGAKRGAALTQRLLAFSRRQELKPTSVDFVALVQGMRELLVRALGSRVKLLMSCQDELPPILVDTNQLELALLNLAVNARDAMPEGGELKIEAAMETVTPGSSSQPLAPGEYLQIRVSDTGAGMDTATLAKATEPFFTTKGPGKGTGLGLPMVRGLAAQSAGYMRISSEIGSGTTVALWFPKAHEPAASSPRQVEMSGVLPHTELCKVLVVDDDALVLEGTAAMIDDLGHTSIGVNSAAEALDKLASGLKIDVVVTDQAMPAMSGLQLARVILDRYPRVPVILATGSEELPFEAKQLGVPRLTKPYSQQDIALAIQAALHKQRLPQVRAF